MQVVKKEYSSHAHQQFSFNFGFKNVSVSLDIPQKGLQLDEWKITPFYYPIVSSSPNVVVVTFCFVFRTEPKIQQVFVIVNSLQIERQQVNHFNSGKNIPKCELVLEWGQDTPPTLLHHSVGLLGADDPHNYFLLHVNPGKCLICIHPCMHPALYPPILPSLSPAVLQLLGEVKVS